MEGGVGGAGHVAWPVAQPFRAAAFGRPPAAYRQAPAASRPEPRAEEGERAVALLDRAIAAKGGIDKLRALKTIVARQTQASQRPEGETMIETTNYIEYPNRFRVEAPEVVQGYDGTRSWMKDRRGVHDAPETQAREAAASLRRDVVALLVAAKDGSLTPRILPDVKDAEGNISHALELSARDLNPVILYVDPDNGLIRKRMYTADAPGRPVIEEQFFDYRPVDGVQIAFRATQKVGALSVERKVIDVKLNTPLDAALFKRPAS